MPIQMYLWFSLMVGLWSGLFIGITPNKLYKALISVLGIILYVLVLNSFMNQMK